MLDEIKNLTFVQKMFEIQNELEGLVKTKENKFLKDAKYFDINQVIAHLKPLLKKYRIHVMQPLVVCSNGKPGVATILRNVDSEDFESYETSYPDPADAQKAGSSITYFRRYSLVSIFLLESEDDDGRKAVMKEKTVDIVPLLEKIGSCKTIEELKTAWKGFKPKERSNPDLVDAMGKMKTKLNTIEVPE